MTKLVPIKPEDIGPDGRKRKGNLMRLVQEFYRSGYPAALVDEAENKWAPSLRQNLEKAIIKAGLEGKVEAIISRYKVYLKRIEEGEA